MHSAVKKFNPIRLSSAEKKESDPAEVAKKMDDETALLYIERILDENMTAISHCWKQACEQYPVLAKTDNFKKEQERVIRAIYTESQIECARHREELLDLDKKVKRLERLNKEKLKRIKVLTVKKKVPKKKKAKEKPKK
jgi:hypothetical protein